MRELNLQLHDYGGIEGLPTAPRRVLEGLHLTQAHLDRFSGIFLIGREPGFGLAEVERLAEGMVRLREALNRRGDKAAKARLRGRLLT